MISIYHIDVFSQTWSNLKETKHQLDRALDTDVMILTMWAEL